MKTIELREGQFLTYIPSGALIAVDDVSPWNATLRNLMTGVSTVVTDDGLSLYNYEDAS